MKIIPCKQGSAEWFAARLGKPTASGIGNIVTGSGKPRSGERPRRYMLELLGERLTGQPCQHYETESMIRGSELEPSARAMWELKTGNECDQVGFILSDCGRYGCSPDGLCGEDGGIEIKCPMLPTYLDIATSGKIPEDHLAQVQFCLFITGRLWWDYVLYTDARGMMPVIMRQTPDKNMHETFDKSLAIFVDELNAMEENMRKRGNGVLIGETQEEVENGYEGCPFD